MAMSGPRMKRSTVSPAVATEHAYSRHHAGEHAREGAAPWTRRGQRVGADQMTRLANVIAWALAAVLVLLLVTPLLALVLRAIDNLNRRTETTSEFMRQALVLSLVTTAVSLTIVVILGTPLAYLLARREFAGRRLIETLVDLPLVLPPAVAGIALLAAFGRRGLFGDELGALGISLPFTSAAVVLAQIFVAVPFYVRSARAGFSRIDRDLESAAADLGATPFHVLWTIILPLCKQSLVAGAVLAWARALGEFGATIMFAGNLPGKTQTMPLAIYGRLEAGDLEAALLLSSILLGVSVFILFGVRLVGGFGRGTLS
jgi:molybdate transport system permease protein